MKATWKHEVQNSTERETCHVFLCSDLNVFRSIKSWRLLDFASAVWIYSCCEQIHAHTLAKNPANRYTSYKVTHSKRTQSKYPCAFHDQLLFEQMDIWLVAKWITSLSSENRFLRVGKSDNKAIRLPQSISVSTVHQQSRVL